MKHPIGTYPTRELREALASPSLSDVDRAAIERELTARRTLTRSGVTRDVQGHQHAAARRAAASEAARSLRSIPSEARSAASRANGKRGGRPPRKKAE